MKNYMDYIIQYTPIVLYVLIACCGLFLFGYILLNQEKICKIPLKNPFEGWVKEYKEWRQKK